ncbi:MAG: hypothetical protein ACRDIB_12095, partial [Ardenticatenaceae bacterium]
MLAPGMILRNRYHIVRPLSQSARGGVYEALDQHLGRPVAIKAWYGLNDAQRRAVEVDARERLLLHHPALAPMREYFAEGDACCVVMEFIPGPTAADRVAQPAQEEASVLAY